MYFKIIIHHFYPFYFSITEAIHRLPQYWFLEWLTSATNQHLVTQKLYSKEMLLHSYQSLMTTVIQAQKSGVISGLLTIAYQLYQTYTHKNSKSLASF